MRLFPEQYKREKSPVQSVFFAKSAERRLVGTERTLQKFRPDDIIMTRKAKQF